MDFGPFGLGEVLFIALLALVLFGPKRLPELARSVGSVVTALRRGTEELKRSFQEELDSAGGESLREVRGLSEELRSATEDIRDIGRGVVDEGRKLVTGESVARGGDAAVGDGPSGDGESDER